MRGPQRRQRRAWMRSWMCSGNTSGRDVSECGQMGQKRMHGTSGCTMLPPAARLYAVLPVGVATIRPSPCSAADHTIVNKD